MLSDAVWELVKNEYITRSQGRDDKGKMTAIEYIIFEQPQPPVLENPMQLNKDILSKELLNTDVSSTYSIPIHSTISPEESAVPPERKENKYTDMDAVRAYEEVIKDNIEYGYLCQDTQIDTRQLNEIDIINPPCQALSGHNTQLDFCHIKPASMLRGVMNL